MREPGHEKMTFDEPENLAGTSAKRPRKRPRVQTTGTAPVSESTPETAPTSAIVTPHPGAPQPGVPQPGAQWPGAPWPGAPHPGAPWPMQQGIYGWPPLIMPYGLPGTLCGPSAIAQVIPPLQPGQGPSVSTGQPMSYRRAWRQRKAAQEDQERIASGQPPKKRNRPKDTYTYKCTLCGKQKSKKTGHTQQRGKWYCPSMNITIEEWLQQLQK